MRHFSWELVIISVAISILLVSPAIAAEKNWSASGDGSSWSDDDNWYPEEAPALSDDVVIDTEDASVVCGETFNAKSITVGGRETSTLTSENFIYGNVVPDTTSDIAISSREKGTITLKGAGILTLKGQYKDSEESLTPEPSFIFSIK